MSLLKSKPTSVIIISLFFIFAYSITFTHEYFTKLTDWKPFEENNRVYDKAITDAKSGQTKLLNKLEKNQLNITEYIKKSKEVSLQKQIKLKEYHIKKEELKQAYSFLGASSLRYFLYALGFPVFALCISVFSIFMVYQIPDSNVYKRFYMFGYYGFIFVSCFWLFHTLFANSNFPKWCYYTSVIILSLSATGIVYFKFYLSDKKKREQARIQRDIDEIMQASNRLINLIFKKL